MKKTWNIALKIAPRIVLAVLLCCLPVTESRAAKSSTQAILEGAKIDFRYSASSSAVVGHFEQLSGKVAVLRDQGKTGYWAKKEDLVHASDTVVSLDGAARIKFRSHDVAILAADSTLQVERFVEGAATGKKEISLRSSVGNTMFYVFRLFGYRDVDFTVQTPSKVAAVRGTKFGIAVRNDDEEMRNWLFRGNTWDPRENNARTDCFCEDGLVEIAGFFLGPDDFYREERGEVIPLSSAEGSEFLQMFLPTFGALAAPTDSDQPNPEDSRDRALLRSETDAHEEIETRRQLDEFPSMIDDDDRDDDDRDDDDRDDDDRDNDDRDDDDRDDDDRDDDDRDDDDRDEDDRDDDDRDDDDRDDDDRDDDRDDDDRDDDDRDDDDRDDDDRDDDDRDDDDRDDDDRDDDDRDDDDRDDDRDDDDRDDDDRDDDDRDDDDRDDDDRDDDDRDDDDRDDDD